MSEEIKNWLNGKDYILIYRLNPQTNGVNEDLKNYVKQLQQENKELKEKLDISETNYDIIYDYFSQINKILNTKLIEEIENKILYFQKRDNILTEFEKWLEEDFKNETEHPTPQIYCNCYSCKIKVLDKLQELKEDKK